MTLVLANSVSENGLWGAVIALAFTGIGTLLLHLFLIVGKSVADSQVPRIELIRKSLEDFCEGSFEFSRLGDLALKWHGKKALQPNFSKEELFEVQYVAARSLSKSASRCRAIGYSGIAQEIASILDKIPDDLNAIDACDDTQGKIKLGREYERWLGLARVSVVEQFENALREEAHLSTAINRYFGR